MITLHTHIGSGKGWQLVILHPQTGSREGWQLVALHTERKHRERNASVLLIPQDTNALDAVTHIQYGSSYFSQASLEILHRHAQR